MAGIYDGHRRSTRPYNQDALRELEDCVCPCEHSPSERVILSIYIRKVRRPSSPAVPSLPVHSIMSPYIVKSLVYLLFIAFVSSQDECNKLPLRGHIDIPLHSLIPQTLTPSNTTMCDKYAFKNDTQLAWITRLINLAFVGDYTPVQGPKWPEVANGTYQGTGLLDPKARYKDPCDVVEDINLLQYFDGSLMSTNRGGNAVALSFLDGGGIDALRQNVPAFNTSSNQYRMLVGFYQYFGYFFGCTDGSVPLYNGSASQSSIHRFMNLPAPYVHYFIHNIVDAAQTLGVPGVDVVTHVGDGISIGIALDNVFNKKCSPPQKVVDSQPADLQSVCGDAK